MTRPDPRVQRTRSDVHDAVLRLLGDGGLRAVTHTAVAEASGVSRATVYRHYPDRETLIAATLEALRPQLDLPEPTGDLGTDARTLLRLVARHLNDNRMVADLLVLLRQAEDDPDLGVAREHLVALEGNPVLGLVEAGRAAGTIRDDLDPVVTAATLIGPVLAMRVMLRIDVTEQMVDDVVTVWLQGVRHDG